MSSLFIGLLFSSMKGTISQSFLVNNVSGVRYEIKHKIPQTILLIQTKDFIVLKKTEALKGLPL